MELEITDSVKFISRQLQFMQLHNNNPKQRDIEIDALIREYKKEGENQREVFWQIIANLFFLIPSQLQKYGLKGNSFDDAVQNSIIHIERGLQHFDPNYGVKFSSYLINYHIIESAAKEILNQEGVVYIPYNKRKQLLQKLKEREDPPANTGLVVSIDEDCPSVSAFLEEFDYSNISSNVEAPQTIDQELYSKEIREILEKALNETSTILTVFERTAVIHKFGLFGAPTLKLDEIQGVFNTMERRITKVRICQVIQQALKKLKKHLHSLGVTCSF